MEEDDGQASGAHRLGLPMALAKHLAGDLVGSGWGDFDEFCRRRREVVRARKEVAGNGLKMSVAQPGAGLEGCDGEGFEAVGRRGHHPATDAFAAARRKALALSAPVGSSSCLK